VDAVSDLATWLLEQIAKDVRVAEAALDKEDPGYVWHAGKDTGADAVHMVRWQPSRVLADRAALREAVHRLVDLMPPFSSKAFNDKLAVYHFGILMVLAQPYADRPGYDESWRP
jgi:hypothetical protein